MRPLNPKKKQDKPARCVYGHCISRDTIPTPVGHMCTTHAAIALAALAQPIPRTRDGFSTLGRRQ